MVKNLANVVYALFPLTLAQTGMVVQLDSTCLRDKLTQDCEMVKVNVKDQIVFVKRTCNT